MGKLEGKVALVTGAGRGQGRSHALTLAREGASIVAVDVPAAIETVDYEMSSRADLAETVKGVEELDQRILAVEADARSQEALDRAVAAGLSEFGQLDILVANHGILSIENFWEMSEATWNDVIDVNLTGVWRAAKAVAPHMIERRQGVICMTGSINAIETGPGYTHYNVSKAGVVMLMKNIALELGGYGIRCNAILPGAADTRIANWQGLYDKLIFPGATAEDLQAATKNWTALKDRRLLNPRALSNGVLFLVSDDAADITGVALPIDAGHLILPGFNHTPG